jgi:hypothetical protein
MWICEPARYVDAMCQRCKPVCRYLICGMCRRHEKEQNYETATVQSYCRHLKPLWPIEWE